MTNEKQDYINVRVPEKMKKALGKKARREHRTLSSYIRTIFLKVIGK